MKEKTENKEIEEGRKVDDGENEKKCQDIKPNFKTKHICKND